MARVVLITDFSEAYARRLLLGMARYTHEVGEAWSLSRLPSVILDSLDIDTVVEYVRKLKPDAIIGQFRSQEQIDRFSQSGIIVIAQDFKDRFERCPNIAGDHYLAGKIGAEYFIAKGFKTFAFYGPRDMVFSSERFRGFKETVQAASPDFSLFSLRPPSSQVWEYDLEELSSWLIYLPKPVAIMAADDNWAYYVTEACQLTRYEYPRLHIDIPRNIALLGVDNDETICNLSSPNLSSIDQYVEAGGYKIAKQIRAKLRGEISSIDDVVVMPTQVITRQSSDILLNEDKNISKVLRYIHSNLTGKISVEDVIAQVPISRRLLETRFHEKMGTSIYNYILSARVDKLCDLLVDGLSIKEASSEAGFIDSKNLSRIFKKVKGVTPSEYLKEIRHRQTLKD